MHTDPVPLLNVARLRGRLAEEQVPRKHFATEACVNLKYLNRILSGEATPAISARARILAEAYRRRWYDVALTSGAGEPRPAFSVTQTAVERVV